MLVGDWMSTDVYTLKPDEMVITAMEMMREIGIRQIPVIESSGLVVGIVTDRDIRDAMPSKFLQGDSTFGKNGHGLNDLKIRDIMSHDPLVVTPDTCMEVAAKMLLESRIGGLPVIDDIGIVGIITAVDIFRFLTSATGVDKSGTQLSFTLDDTASALSELLNDLWSRGLRISTIFTSYDGVETGQRKVFVWIQRIDEMTLVSLVKHLKQTYKLSYYVHQEETFKEF
ncbi:CBS and ACT domain-containing protein [Maridesulfovibrio bastinii]|uniref:CBS and ACT domain-containing protein n=1 Tax=Maridesulfovibrio bastinii TaxID=47157 RepID=UPI0004879532|nr:CBS and ACT domain-containing protein [Maridesulfovibrio bastinii]